MNGVITSLQSSAAERIGWMLIHSLWQLALLAGAYLVVRQLLQRRSAALRYLAACAIMSCMVLALPLTALRVDVQPPTVLTQLRSDKALLSTIPPLAERTPSELAVEAKSPIHTAITVNAQWVSTQADPIAPPAVARWKERIRDLFAPVLPWIVAAWLIGVVVLAVRQLGGWMVMRRLCGAGTEPVDGAVVKKLQQIAKRLGVQRAVRLLASGNVDVPSVVGHFKPVILLPVSLISGFTPDEIEAILGHELAHIRRHDYLIHLIQTTFETLLFYHPAVWWVSREIRRERENCCDDLAVYACGDRVAYARTLAKLEEDRASIPATAMAASGGSLLDRIRRLVGQPVTHHTPRGTWLAGVLVILSVCVILPIGMAVGSGEPIDFDFNDPPMGYEHGIRAAGTGHQIKAGRLRFKLSDVTRGPNGTLNASLGLEDGYEVVMFRLFDHATRKLVHDSEWQLNLTNNLSTRKFQATRVGETDQVRIEQTGGTLPKSLDLWLRIVENGRGDRIRIPAKQDASTKHGNSEIVVTSLLAGSMSGKGSPSGKMIWDTLTSHNTSWQTTVDLENRGKILRGRYHLVAVTKKGWRHAMNHKHFLDFSQHGRHNYTQLDVPLDQIDHFELILFKKRHKFFFNGVVVPRTAKADRKTAPSADRSPQAAAGRRLTEAAGRRRFLAIERIARWPMAKQAKGLPHFYRNLDPRSINPMVEGILSSYPRNILDTKSGPYDGNTIRWAQQLADAASTMSAEQVADQLGGRLWLAVAARARALQIFKKHAVATSSLVDADLKSGDKFAVQRACNTIAELELRSSAKRLLAMFMVDNELSDPASGALAQLRDPSITGPLLERVEQDPQFLVRCAALLYSPLWGKTAHPLLLQLLDSRDAEVRDSAARAVQGCRDPKLAQPIIRLARDKEARFRVWAAMLASKLPPQSFKAVRNNLLALLNDKDESVRFDALRCFGGQKDLAAGSVILELLRREQIDEGHQVTVMQSMSALSGKTWNYNVHNWGPDKPGNGSAIQQFEAWLKKQRRKTGVTTGPVDIEIVAATTNASISGQVTGKDPTSGAKYSSNTKTDAEGRYHFASPFEVAERVLINDGDFGYVSAKENVIHGRADVDFQLAAKGSINWGKPVDGVQTRLTRAERILGRSDWPHPVLRLRYDAKNEGQYTLHLPKNGLSHQVEVDGQWYEWVDPRLATKLGEPVVSARGGVLLDFESGRLHEGQEEEIAGNWRAIPKGKESAYAARQYGSGYLVVEADDGKELVLTQGRHQVRIAVLCPSARAPFHGVVRAVSQPLWVEIDALSARAIEIPRRAGEISGVLLGHDGDPVPLATLVLCDQATGIPVSKQTFKPFVEGKMDLKSVLVVTTDAKGKFLVKDVPEGRYRVIAQSWPDAASVLEIFAKNGKEITLRGVQDNILVPSEEAKNIVIKPMGNCVVSLDEDFPNSDALLLVSTEPLSADPVLGFVSWQGPFLQNLIGANRMPYGVTKIGGLPEGKIHLSVFGNDNNGGIGAGSVVAKSGETVQAEFIPIVCGWSDGRHEPPEHLQQTFTELQRIATQEKNYLAPFLDRLLADKGIVVEHPEKTRNPMSGYFAHLDEIVSLPSGREVRLADVLASGGYIQLQKSVAKQRKPRKKQ